MRLTHLTSALAVQLVCATAASAIPVDGVLDARYGQPIILQTTQTSFGDWPVESMYYGELDGAFGYVADDTLHLFVSGNLNRFLSEPLTGANQLQLFFDTQPGGQNPVSASNPAVGSFATLAGCAGLGFDADFAPDFWLAGSRDAFGYFFAYYAELPAGGGGAGYILGASTIGGDGTLSGFGGSNPYGILAAVDISNTAGVTGGCDASSGAGVTVGAEWAIPLVALGHPTGAIGVSALLVQAAGLGQNRVSNQLLGPVPPGTCSLGLANAVDLSSIDGSQYFTIDQLTPTTDSSWGRIKSMYR